MNIPPDQLDEALRRVQQGLMQPNEAAKWLLDLSTTKISSYFPQPSRSQPSESSQVESRQPITIADLLDKLGPPPDEIQRDWDEQLAAIAFEFERSTGRAFPEVSIHDILVDSNNDLSLSSALTLNVAPTVRPVANHSNQDDVLNVSAEIKAGKPPTSKHEPKRKKTSQRKTPNLLAKHRWLQPTAFVLGAVLTLGLTFYFLTPSEESKPVEITARTDSIFSPKNSSSSSKTISRPAIRETAPAMSTLLELADESALMTPGTEAASTAPVQQPMPSKTMLGLDSFAGGNWGSGTDLLPTADFGTAIAEADTAITEADTADSRPDDDELADDITMAQADHIDDAPDSPTSRASGVTSIELPSIPTRSTADDEIELVSIAELSVDKIELLFPAELGLSLASDNGSWVVHDNKDKAKLATFVAGENNLQFRWTALAATRPVAKLTTSAMLNLALRDGTARPLFLRPEVKAEAWPIDLTTGDAKSAWPISTSPPTGTAKLNVAFHVPETVVQTWVQPHDPAQFRRSQSLVEFSLANDSKVAIRSRLELKTGTRITLRMRHAAQLDPSFPWQMISTTRVLAAIEQVTNQSTLALAEQDRIKAIYNQASSAEKKFLVPHRDSIDTVVLRLRDLSKRLTKYDQLLSQLDHVAHMTLHLDVAWPDPAPLAHQVIFAMNAPPNSSP